MSVLNIVGTGGDQEDSAYRYKMPSIIGKIEGRGNGIKTVIVNAESVAMSLHRPTAHLTKYFGCELGAQTKWDTKLEKSIVNGAHDTKELQRLVHKYCDDFVLCPTCSYPETTLRIKSAKREIWHVCKACGAKHMVDMTHKLCTFILKEAKAKKNKKLDAAEKKRKDKEKRKDKDRKKDKKEKKEKKKKKKKEKDEQKVDSNVNADENGIVWATDFSDEAVRMRKLEEQARQEKARRENGQGGEDDGEEEEEEEKTREQVLEEAVARIQDDMKNGAQPEAIKDTCINLQVAGCLPAADRVKILYDALMMDCRTAVSFKEKIVESWEYFAALVASLSSGPDAMLKAIETHFTTPKYAGLVPAVAVLLEALYDTDILEEQIIVSWAASPSEGDVAVVKAKAQPFIAWLKEAEDDDDEEEEEDDE